MKKYARFGVLALLGLALTVGAGSCSDDDPDYENVTPPEVEVTHQISGLVDSYSGGALSGVTVTLGGAASATATTDGNGNFVFENVKPGEYSLKAEAEGMVTVEGSVTVTESGDGQNPVWNVTLKKVPEVVKVTVSQTEEVQADVQTETLKDNEVAQVKVDVVVPPAALELPEGDSEEEAVIEMTPVYDEADVTERAAARAGDWTLLAGAKLSCTNKNARLKKAIGMTLNVDENTARNAKLQKLSGGVWKDVENTDYADGKLNFEADEFTSYALRAEVAFSSKAAASASIDFTKTSWDNLYGSTDMTVGDATYTYQLGVTYQASTDQLGGLLKEKLAGRHGASSSTAQGRYPLNVTLPVGTKLEINGSQKVMTVTASCAGHSVSGTLYGSISISVTTSNRQHTGGSN